MYNYRFIISHWLENIDYTGVCCADSVAEFSFIQSLPAAQNDNFETRLDISVV